MSLGAGHRTKVCKFPGCVGRPDASGGARGYCPGHYKQLLRGDTLAVLGVSRAGIPRPLGWTDSELDTATRMFAAGRTHREIGAVIGRSTEAVRLKLNYIGSGRDEGKDGGPRCQERMVSGGPCGLLLPCAGPHHTTAHAAQARKGVEW